MGNCVCKRDKVKVRELNYSMISPEWAPSELREGASSPTDELLRSEKDRLANNGRWDVGWDTLLLVEGIEGATMEVAQEILVNADAQTNGTEAKLNGTHIEAAQAAKPTLESLAPDSSPPDWVAAVEWAPLTAKELQVIALIRGWLGEEASAAVPADLLACFVRGYAYREDGAAASFAYLDAALRWRAESGVDALVRKGFEAFGAPRYEEFDELVPGGTLGHDKYGHLVVIERICLSPVSKVMSDFTDDEFVANYVARREVMRAAACANSYRLGRRVYKFVVIFDIAGCSLSHLNKEFIERMKRTNAIFSNHYPESTYKMLIINAPRVFTAVWAVVKVLLHPVTAAKVFILGSNYHATFAELGIELEEGVPFTEESSLPDDFPSYAQTYHKIIQEHPREQLARGYCPDADRKALDAL